LPGDSIVLIQILYTERHRL